MPVIVREPTVSRVPAVFDSPHSGNVYPADFGATVPLSALRSGEDAFVDEIFGAAPAHGATLIAATFPRAYIDPNRALADLDAGMLDEPWPGPLSPGPKTARGKGLIWRTVGRNVPIYDRRLGAAEVRNRIERYWRPYNEALDRAVERAHDRFGGVWHVDCHSMGSVWPAGEIGAGTPVEADFLLGDRDGTTCAPAFTAFVRETLEGMGYAVAVNDRFKGVEIVRRLGRPADNRHSLQIEIVRGRYMDERAFERNGGFEKLRADVDRLVAAVCDYAKAAAR